MKTTDIALFVTVGMVLPFLQTEALRAQPQTAARPPEFEVASVKLANVNSPNGVAGGCHGIDSTYGPGQTAPPPLGRCVITDARLSHMINIAWSLNSMQLIRTGPDWIARGEERYNVEAKAEDAKTATEQQLLKMLQSLLVDRFQLKFHNETVDVPGFSMGIAKNGPKLKASTADETRAVFGGESLKPVPGRPVALKARKYSMPMLANLLSQIGRHGPVIDNTGLTGFYDFTLSWDEDAGPELSTAVQEQLGLRFTSQKIPVTSFIVDSAQKPTAN